MYYVGTYNEKQLKAGTDKKEVAEAKVKTGLTYTQTKIVKIKGVKHLKIWLCSLDEWAALPLL